MEEFFLGRFLAGNELNIIDQEHVNRAVLITKDLRGVCANSVDQVIGKFFG